MMLTIACFVSFYRTMPASKFVNVLAILRKSLSLKQGELAELAGCSISTIQAIEANKLPLSRSLAARISASTGVDFDWILANDVTVPMPAIKRLEVNHPAGNPGATDWVTPEMLSMVFGRLFVIANRLPITPERRALEMNIGFNLDRLKNGEGVFDPDIYYSIDSLQFLDVDSNTLHRDLAQIINFKYLIEEHHRRRKLLEKEADKERRESSRKWKELEKAARAIKAKPADQRSDEEKAILQKLDEHKKWLQDLNVTLANSRKTNENAGVAKTAILPQTESRKTRQSPKRSRRSA
jgi:transcriptional regulator with XRE-family HTH domain/DNA-binding transcriptional MerR regulator